MKTYWDASALITGIGDLAVASQILSADQFTRVHSLAEMFSTLTGGRLGFRFEPNKAAEMIKRLTQNLNFVELSASETKQALSLAQKKGIRGGHVHDWLHVVAAKKAGVKKLLTNNLSDFQSLKDSFIVASP
jgi:predicted nucleic acid-binding protein